VGFNVHETFGRKGDNSLGLPGIRDRLEALGGTLQIDSGPIEGTILTILIPELITLSPISSNAPIMGKQTP
jgi:signal transduction histidine kinase